MCVGQPDGTHTYADAVALNPPVLEVGSEENGIGQHALVYPERSALRFLIKVRTGRIEKDLVKF